MKKLLITLCITLLSSFFVLGPGLKINSEEAIVKFQYVSDETVGTVKGIKAEIEFDSNSPSKAVFSGTADISTIDTENSKRDNHLKADEFFDIKKYPTISFKSSSIEKAEKGFLMKGEMTIKEITNTVEINFTYEDNTFIGKTKIYGNDYDFFKKEKKKEDSKILIVITIPIL
jgi:polyisoprenoid-binding protein YceI